jgi:hypothetical protein
MNAYNRNNPPVSFRLSRLFCSVIETLLARDPIRGVETVDQFCRKIVEDFLAGRLIYVNPPDAFLDSDLITPTRVADNHIVSFRLPREKIRRIRRLLKEHPVLGIKKSGQFCRKLVEDFLGCRLIYLNHSDFLVDSDLVGLPRQAGLLKRRFRHYAINP